MINRVEFCARTGPLSSIGLCCSDDLYLFKPIFGEVSVPHIAMATAAVVTQFPSPVLTNDFQVIFRNLSDENQNLLTRIWSNGLGKLDEIEESYRPTPIQTEIITSDVQQWCNLHIVLPPATFKLIDRINYIWHKLSTHRKSSPGLYIRKHAILGL